MVYQTPVQNIADLEQRVMAAAAQVRNNVGMLDRVRESLLRRADACVVANGGHIEHFL